MTGKKAAPRVFTVLAIVAGGCLAIAALIWLGASGVTASGLPAGNTTRGGLMEGSAVSGIFTVDERRSLPLGGVGLVSVTTVSEHLRIIDGTGDQLQAWLHGEARGEAPRLVVERSADGIDVHLEHSPVPGPNWNDLTLEVSFPAAYAGKIAARSVSAGIDLADHAYDGVAISTTSGEVRAGSLKTGDFAMHSISGALRAAAVNARQLDISSVSGEVEVPSVAGTTTVRTTSGEVRLTFSTVPTRLEASSTSGAVSLRLPADAGFTLDARSTSGEVSCEFPLARSAQAPGRERHALSGVVGNGSALISAHTTSGRIQIGK
jgi:hypothetical protein